jgi:para-aminobenzoate synthetase/4-amino-4-deoxychorismate lyase
MFGARFDDAIAGRSFELIHPVEELVAWTVGDVIPTLERVRVASKAGMWVAGYVSYEAASAFDTALVTRQGTRRPLAWFGIFGSRRWTEAPTEGSARTAYSVSGWTPSVSREEYRQRFDTIRSHIHHGDTYQVNLTFPLTAAFSGETSAFYNDLLSAQQPAYACHLFYGDTHIVSSSPERFFTVADGRIVTSPMKGTARRGRWLEEDQSARERLAMSDKDKAENLMIVDLVRNDLGRVARFGSVRVDELFAIEGFKTVWQMTSTISADLAPDVTLVDVFSALFPCGSVTGAPKTSSMAVIADIEASPRDVYCGAIGFIPPGDGLDGASFNVAIRTAVIDESEGIATFGVGGGVTWYSEAEAEYDETVTKALVLARRTEPFGLIETIRWDPAEIDPWILLDDHLGRLESSSEYFGIGFDRSEVVDHLNAVVVGKSSAQRVRLVVSDGGVETQSVELSGRFALGPSPESRSVVLAIDETAIDSTDPVMFHKTTNRYAYTMRGERHPDADDVVLVNEAGFVTESTIANIAVKVEDVWVTPPRDDGLLAGVLRNHLVSTGVIKERSITVEEFRSAEAVAVVNSVRGWRRAVIGQHLS